MDYLILEGVPPYDGRYEFDLRPAAQYPRVGLDQALVRLHDADRRRWLGKSTTRSW